MGNWLYTLDIKEIQNLGKEDSISPKDWATSVAKAIKNQLFVLYNNDEELEQIVFELEYDVPEDATWNETDDILGNLYDWADDVRCWVRSF